MSQARKGKNASLDGLAFFKKPDNLSADSTVLLGLICPSGVVMACQVNVSKDFLQGLYLCNVNTLLYLIMLHGSYYDKDLPVVSVP